GQFCSSLWPFAKAVKYYGFIDFQHGRCYYHHMHPIQEKLLELSKRENLATLSLREMAKRIKLPSESPQKIKHHLLQLQKKGFLSIDRAKGMMNRTSSTQAWAKGLLHKAARLFSIPII